MLEWLCDRLMEAEVSAKIGAEKSQQTSDRQSNRSGYRPRQFDTRMGTLYLTVPKVRRWGLYPVFCQLAQTQRSGADSSGAGGVHQWRFAIDRWVTSTIRYCGWTPSV
jgi:transposase-like protein